MQKERGWKEERENAKFMYGCSEGCTFMRIEDARLKVSELELSELEESWLVVSDILTALWWQRGWEAWSRATFADAGTLKEFG